ncbi:MAG TPA: hypothetical protein VGM23_03520 [Armatimonadota bacterium]
MTALKSAFTAMIVLALLAASQPGAFAYPAKPFNLQRLLDGSTSVAKVRVLVTEKHGTCLDPRFRNDKPVTQVIAHVTRLAEIKGSVAEKFDIAYPNARIDNVFLMVPYPDLTREQVCLVFLSGKASPYHFFDLDQPILGISDTVVAFQPDQSPKERLMAELRATAQQTQGYRRIAAFRFLMQLGDQDALRALQAELFATAQHAQGAEQLSAIEELACLGDRDDIMTLQATADKQDVALYGVLLSARVLVKEAPPSAELLAFLQRDAREFDEKASLKRYSTTGGYALIYLQRSLLGAICGSVQQSNGNDHSVKKLANFPYVDLFREALKTTYVKQDTYSREDIGRALRELRDPQSMPFLIELLDVPDLNYFAVTALASINNMDYMYIATFVFEKDPQKYISFWRNWWKQHKQEYL